MSRDDDPSQREPLSALEELWADRVTVGLDADDTERLAELLGASGRAGSGDGDADSWERAAAAVDLALLDAEEPAIPDLLARRVQDDAREFFAERGAAAAPSSGRSSVLPWTVAALCAAAAIVLLLTRPAAPGDGKRADVVAEGPDGAGATETTGTEPGADAVEPESDTAESEPESAEPSPAERRSALLSREGTVRLPWAATEDPAAEGATGDVVWNDAEQRGYLRIRGLAANDIEAMQYQLWIFDPDRDDRYPVDGGVFDIPAGADEVVVPIDAKLAVAGPNLFAVTVEKPGGVVVSSRERIVLLAQAGS